MADKEATVYVIDLGHSMGEKSQGRKESNLDFGMRYVWDKISTTVAASRRTWTIGVIGLRTDETSNSLDEAGLEGYENISVLQEIGPMSMTDLRNLRGEIKVSKTKQGDAISAIVIASSMIEEFTKKLKYNRKIILVTDGKGAMDADSLDEVTEKLNDVGIELIVIGVDFDDADYGFKEEDKPKQKKKNEEILSQLVGQCKRGVYGTMAQAVEELSIPRIKPVRPFKSYDGPLTLGDPEIYPNAMSIAVERYFKTKLAHPPSASTVVVNNAPSRSQVDDDDEAIEDNGNGLGAVRQVRAYRVNDPDAPGGKRDVDFDSLEKGYEYGRTVVPMSAEDESITNLQTTKSFTILGFIPFDSYEPHLSMGEAGVIVAQKHNEKAELALSSLVNALYELQSYAVARYVNKDNSKPFLHLLIPDPKLEGEADCLFDVPLPFAEDIRSYQFPPLDKVITVEGTVLKQHRLLPTPDLTKAVSDLVDAMDLSKFGKDNDGNPTEYAPIDETYNPTIHRINQAIRHRAVHPDEPLQPPAEILLRFSKPPDDLIDNVKKQIDNVIKVADVKQVPPKVKGKRKRDTVKPISGLDVDALLGQAKRTKIDPANAIPEFKQALGHATEVKAIEDATRQMGEVVCDLIKSFAGINYDRAAAHLAVMREELIGLEEPGLYNGFLTELKKKIFGKELDGDRKDMWREKIVAGGLGLVTDAESEVSGVSEAEAKKFEK
ncbi:SPOC like C-terminal domain-containing protein [Coniochaeta sp. 2T2.1]|nr:SPOC like C-terminal domain-containing protein [Coniochaeta sp. 2T2.1]